MRLRLIPEAASYTGLLGLMAFAMFAARIAPISPILTLAIETLIVVSMVWVVRKIHEKWGLVIVVAATAAVAEGATLMAIFDPGPAWVVIDHLATVAFIVLVLGRIMVDVWRQEVVDIDTIVGGIVVYLMIGVAYSGLYQTLEFVAPGSFVVSNPEAGLWGPWQPEPGNFPRLFFFSFVTLTTLGYGDIVPASGVAGALTSLEAATGSLYLTILIARLVGSHIAASTASRDG